MDKNEIIERLERLARCAVHTVGELPFVMSLDEGIAIHEAIDMLRTQAEPHWIPCSERLPENERKTYWVCTDTGHQCECRWTNVNHFWTDLTTDWHWHIMDIPRYTEVVAWMPLPEPYKEGEQDG